MNAPEEYAALNDLHRYETSEVMKEFRDEVKAMHGRVMDIGCGPGGVTRDVILPQLPDDAVIVGIDMSPEMIKYAEENHRDEKKLSFLQLNIEITELPKDLNEKYDNAISIFCLHWCKNTGLAFNNIYKLLKPSGAILFLYISNHIACDVYLELQENSEYSIYMQDAVNYVPPQYGLPDPEKLLKNDVEKSGFDVLHCTNRERTFQFKNLNNFLDLLMSATPFLKEMPDKLKKNYRSDVKKIVTTRYSLDENNDSNDIPFVDKYSFIVAYCKKPAQK